MPSVPFTSFLLYRQDILTELKILGFMSDSGLRPELRQHSKCIGCPTEYYVDFYPELQRVDIYSREKRGTKSELTERFAGRVETPLDLARLLWQVEFITADKWEAAQLRHNAKPPNENK
jgi:hypothetical protein